ncbi:MAG: hypothetical protein ACK55I_37125, partial [bacterium]
MIARCAPRPCCAIPDRCRWNQRPGRQAPRCRRCCSPVDAPRRFDCVKPVLGPRVCQLLGVLGLGKFSEVAGIDRDGGREGEPFAVRQFDRGDCGIVCRAVAAELEVDFATQPF